MKILFKENYIMEIKDWKRQQNRQEMEQESNS